MDRQEETPRAFSVSSVNSVGRLSNLWKQLSFISSQKKGNVIKEIYEVTKLLAALGLASVPLPVMFPRLPLLGEKANR